MKWPNFDLEDYLKTKDLFFKRHESGDHIEIAICCEECTENGERTKDESFKCWINPENGFYTCYRCGASGTMVKLIQVLSNVPKIAAIKILQGRKISPFEALDFKLVQEYFDFDDDEIDLKEIELPYGFVGFDEIKSKTVYHRYLKQRGISLSYAIENGWGFSHVGYVAGRIIVPMFVNDRLVFWQARDVLGEKHPHWGDKKLYKKTLNPVGVSARHVLYNFDSAKNYDEIILCEGFIDAAKAGENAVASNGKKLHSNQVELLTQTKATRICILYDPDAFTDGNIKRESSVKKASDMLKSFFSVRAVRLPPGRDAGSYDHDELQKIITNKKAT